jgi:hypothetical protein
VLDMGYRRRGSGNRQLAQGKHGGYQHKEYSTSDRKFLNHVSSSFSNRSRQNPPRSALFYALVPFACNHPADYCEASEVFIDYVDVGKN